MKKFNRLYCTGGIAAFAIACSTQLLRADDHQSSCPADFDQSGAVDINDFSQFLVAWGSTNSTYDLDNSGQVDLGDFSLFLVAFGECPEIVEGPFNYHEALQKAITFYYAQRSGDLPDNYPLTWRGDCFTEPMEQVNGQYPVDTAILNRYMDAGDTPTFVLPISSAMTTMAWSAIDFGDGFTSSDQMTNLLDTLRWHADWCIAAHPEPNVFCGQIDQGGPSHGLWLAPEAQQFRNNYEPKIHWLNEANPGSEPVAESAAFLAAASILFEEYDPEYAATLLQHARELYSFADNYRGTYTASIPDVTSFYNSWSGYFDELTWAATWLYRATGEQTYLNQAEAHYASASPDPNWAQSWDGKINGAACLLAALTGKQQYKTYVEGHLSQWLPGGSIAYTPGGLAWLDTWGSLRYAANSAFIAFAYAELVGDPDGRYQQFGESQINYILGDNPRNSSYVCGFGNNPPTRPHHRGASASFKDDIMAEGENRHILYGALVGGPASADDFDYQDVRSDYIANEVACDYNAGFVAALGRMSRQYDGTPLENFPEPEDSYGKEMFVEASIIEEGDSYTKIRCLLNNRSAWPARLSDALSYRVYVDLSEVFDAGYGVQDVVVDGSFLDGGVISGLQLSNSASNLYFVEVSYDGVLIGPGLGNDYLAEAQFSIGLSNGPANIWNPNNDPSLADLPFGQSAIIKTEMISVYDGGALIYGEEGSLDCNDNGVDDAQEIASGATDIDGNGQLDECQSDCNGNGLPDAYEIAMGADDCDGDGIPDTCQTFDDCDNDGLSDSCAIAQGLVLDCNNNGLPDSCDIASGSTDADSDGVPDFCQNQGLTYRFEVSDQWNGGFTAKLIVSNNSEVEVTNWSVGWDAEYTVSNAWGGDLQSQNSGVVTVVAPEWNATLAPGALIEIGFQGTGAPVAPTQVLVNGNEAISEN